MKRRRQEINMMYAHKREGRGVGEEGKEKSRKKGERGG